MKNTILSVGLAALAPVGTAAQTADTIVKVAAKPLHAGVASLREEVSIGEIEGEEHYLFGQVAEIAAAPDGSIYVFDAQVPALRKYDARGKYVKTLGRKGQGPGEYMFGGGLAVGSDGRVYLWDTGTWRINVYSPAGEYVEAFQTPSGLGANSVYKTSRALVAGTDGSLYYRGSIRGQRGMPSRRVWIRMRNGTITDTLNVPQAGPLPPSLTAEVSNSNGTASRTMPLPFAPQPLEQLSPLGYFVTAYPSRYAFEIPSGRSVLSVRRDVKPEPVTAAERAKEKQDVEETLRGTQPNWSWNGADIPKVKASFDAIGVGADGRIWIPLVRQNSRNNPGVGFSMQSSTRGGGLPRSSPERSTSKEEQRPGLFDVYEPNGTYIGQVRVPANVNLIYRRGDYVWGTALDELDIATVKRYRIVWQ